MVKYFVNLFLLLIIQSCNNAKIVMTRIDNNSNELKLDGYFYRELESGINKGFTNIIFLYNNGVLLDCLNLEKKDFTLVDSYILENFLDSTKSNKNDILNWGVYQILKGEIKIEKWYPSSGGPFPTFITSGEILNDSTFVLNRINLPNGKNASNIKETYHYRKFNPKPDSTNNFIK